MSEVTAQLKRSELAPALHNRLDDRVPAIGRETFSDRRRPRAVNEDPLFVELVKLDRKIASVARLVAAELGDGSRTDEWLQEARGAVFDAMQSFTAESRPKATTYLNAALSRARRRREG